MKTIIRTAEIKDADSIAMLATHMGYESGRINSRERIKTILKNEDNCIFVALQNNEIVAWIHAFYAQLGFSESKEQKVFDMQLS